MSETHIIRPGLQHFRSQYKAGVGGLMVPNGRLHFTQGDEITPTENELRSFGDKFVARTELRAGEEKPAPAAVEGVSAKKPGPKRLGRGEKPPPAAAG